MTYIIVIERVWAVGMECLAGQVLRGLLATLVL